MTPTELDSEIRAIGPVHIEVDVTRPDGAAAVLRLDFEFVSNRIDLGGFAGRAVGWEVTFAEAARVLAGSAVSLGSLEVKSQNGLKKDREAIRTHAIAELARLLKMPVPPEDALAAQLKAARARRRAEKMRSTP